VKTIDSKKGTSGLLLQEKKAGLRATRLFFQSEILSTERGTKAGQSPKTKPVKKSPYNSKKGKENSELASCKKKPKEAIGKDTNGENGT